MEELAFRERLSECKEMPGIGDPVYRSAFNELILEAGGSITLPAADTVQKNVQSALTEDEGREWSQSGETPMDQRLAAFADLYLRADATQKAEIESSFQDEQLRELLVFAGRAARFAVSRKDTQWMRLGL